MMWQWRRSTLLRVVGRSSQTSLHFQSIHHFRDKKSSRNFTKERSSRRSPDISQSTNDNTNDARTVFRKLLSHWLKTTAPISVVAALHHVITVSLYLCAPQDQGITRTMTTTMTTAVRLMWAASLAKATRPENNSPIALPERC